MKPETEHSKEILRWAREKYASAPESEKANWEYMFPELKENEDELIRKRLINLIKELAENKEAIHTGGYFVNGQEKKYIAYLERQKEQKPAEMPKGEDYGIDGLYAAVDILQTTLGKVKGYQTDDGILEHKCAISAVKELYEQQLAEWSEEDEKNLNLAINIVASDLGEDSPTVSLLKSIKNRIQS